MTLASQTPDAQFSGAHRSVARALGYMCEMLTFHLAASNTQGNDDSRGHGESKPKFRNIYRRAISSLQART